MRANRDALGGYIPFRSRIVTRRREAGLPWSLPTVFPQLSESGDRRPRRAGGTAVHGDGRRQDFLRRSSHTMRTTTINSTISQPTVENLLRRFGRRSVRGRERRPGLGYRRAQQRPGHPQGRRRGRPWGQRRGSGRGRSGLERRADDGLDLALGYDLQRLVRDDHGRQIVAGTQFDQRDLRPVAHDPGLPFLPRPRSRTLDSRRGLGR